MDNNKELNIIVNPGDTLYYLARSFSINVSDILEKNKGVIDPDNIFVGQLVKIPAISPEGPNPGSSKAQHLVRKGETFFFIARRLGIDIEELIEVNQQIHGPGSVAANQVINLVVKKPLPPAAPEYSTRIYVRKNETLSWIASRTGVSLKQIIKANPQVGKVEELIAGNLINITL